jgi:hypothetical protein
LGGSLHEAPPRVLWPGTIEASADRTQERKNNPMTTTKTTERVIGAIRQFARGLGAAWAVWMTVSALLSSINEGFSPIMVLGITVFRAIILFGIVAIAVRWEAVGGVLLAVIGVLALNPDPGFAAMESTPRMLVLLTGSFPPIVAGVLFLICWLSRSRIKR